MAERPVSLAMTRSAILAKETGTQPRKSAVTKKLDLDI
jgi:hypothetical protein